MLLTLSVFDKGLSLLPPPEQTPTGFLRRARGLHRLTRSSFRSRDGSALLSILNAHSVFYFNGDWFYGVGTILYRNSTSIQTGLSGNALSFTASPPVAGVRDYLFVLDGSTTLKVDSSGDVTDWGISPPSSLSGAAIAGGALTDATWLYQVTYQNSTTTTRSNGNGTNASVVTSGANNTVRLTLPGASSDAQVDKVEIWRSVANGTALFLLDTVDDTDATYDDDGGESLSSTALPTNNLVPYDYFSQAYGGYNATIFWITRTEAGQRGRLFYSPVGRAEALDGFINVTNDDDPLQRIFGWQGLVGIISGSGIYQVTGTNPYFARPVDGVPGTTKPDTVQVTPSGLVYEAKDGLRIYNGSISSLLTPEGTVRLFQGESLENLTAFSGEVSGVKGDEYYISDNTQTLSVNTRTGRWRDLGIGLTAFYYDPVNDFLTANYDSSIVKLELAGELTDKGNPIPLDFESEHLTLSDDAQAILLRFSLKINTNNQSLNASVLIDDVEVSIGHVKTSTLSFVEIPIGRACNVVGIRIYGTLTQPMELTRITMEYYTPRGEV